MTLFSRFALTSLLSLSFLAPSSASAISSSSFEQKQIDKFVKEMVKEHKFDVAELTQLLSKAEKKQTIIDAMNRPAEGKPWHEYRPIFMTESRIREGVKFLNKNKEILVAAEKNMGFQPPSLPQLLGLRPAMAVSAVATESSTLSQPSHLPTPNVQNSSVANSSSSWLWHVKRRWTRSNH